MYNWQGPLRDQTRIRLDLHGRALKMNSLSLLSSRVIGQSPTSSSHQSDKHHPLHHQRSRSQSEITTPGAAPEKNVRRHRSYSEDNVHANESNALVSEKVLSGQSSSSDIEEHQPEEKHDLDGRQPLLLQQHHHPRSNFLTIVGGRLRITCRRTFNAIADTIRFVLSTLAAPGVYLARFFREEDGRYSLIAPIRKLRRKNRNNNVQLQEKRKKDKKDKEKMRGVNRRRRSSVDSLISSSTSDSEGGDGGSRGKRLLRSSTKSSRASSVDESPPTRSIRIKVQDESRQKEQRRSHHHNHQKEPQQQHPHPHRQASPSPPPAATAALNLDSLKSPTSPSVHKLTRYPHTPKPPRPLVPPRRPSYTVRGGPRVPPQKTLVLDLDETLIHSLAKGGRMTSGHMVEVKLSSPMITALTPGGGPPATLIGPQHPILYYVHKRPHCDDFLRKVCRWYKLVVFTASVQEYADPVIDWLEQERKFFQARYYRQHCTIRNGAYIKDLSSVEPDLSRVMILDNSPMSYIFHEGMQHYFALIVVILYLTKVDIFQIMLSLLKVGSTTLPITGCYT